MIRYTTLVTTDLSPATAAAVDAVAPAPRVSHEAAPGLTLGSSCCVHFCNLDGDRPVALVVG